ncbi:hypothetical protein P261_02708 [Lachnospiraceae bacterium TWA4]|nr:hypothetical protein P261_02708 [Lachnospiraceae bacterium TWA4]
MKKKIIRKHILYILVVLFIFSSSPHVFAHSSSQEGILAKTYHSYGGYYIGGEDVGWSIDEGLHTNGTTLTYSFSSTDTYLNSIYKSYVASGVSKWSGTVNIINKTDGSGTGQISTMNSPNTGTVAMFCKASANSSTGHLTSWQIVMNRAYTQSAVVLAHELGHAIGLNDLYASKNSGKLMYGYTSGTATSPTTSDKWGAKVITGGHSSHTWGYKFVSLSPQTYRLFFFGW